MTAYYTQAQIDEIGALIGQEILNSNEALKQFVQDKIAALEPVTPPAPTEPEAGDGTTPAPAAGMFLDDGREIKQKLLKGVITRPYTPLAHGLIAANIIDYTITAVKTSSSTSLYKAGLATTSSTAFQFTGQISGKNIIVQATDENSNLINEQYFCLITYLA